MRSVDFADNIISLLFPPRCVVCQELVETGVLHCGKCRLEPADPAEARAKLSGNHIGDITILYAYNDDISHAILSMKQYRDKRATGFYAGALAAKLQDGAIRSEHDFVTFIPMNRKSLHKRGFNHCKVLANALADNLGLPCYGDLLAQTGRYIRQRGLDQEDRFANARISYTGGKNINLAAGKRILLVDDVVTTGATILACCERLEAVGAKQISIAAICSTI